MPSQKEIERIKHLNLRYTPKEFELKCSEDVFSTEQIEFIKKYGHWLQGLTDGTLKPISEKQERFVKVMKGELDPFSFEESAWHLYLNHCKMELKHGDWTNMNYSLDGDTFYSRAHVKQLRSHMFKTMRDNHRS